MGTTTTESSAEYRRVDQADVATIDQALADGWEIAAALGPAAGNALYLRRPRLSFRDRVTLDQRTAVYQRRANSLAETAE